MRIQHNIAALNSYRNLTGNNNAVGKNLEKLSSGYRINRAGDDAAGLAISEKMRAQITGLETAQKNANDGISLVQTAEGALTEVHSMLNRMVELADQSANGTYDNDTDRANLQKEISSLKDEIDRISEGTNFNGINLLDGSLGGGATGATGAFGGSEVTLLAAKGVAVEFAVDDTVTGISVDTTTTPGVARVVMGTDAAASTYSAAQINKALADKGIDAKVSLDKDMEFAADATATALTLTASEAKYAKVTVGGVDFESTKAGNITSTVAVTVNATGVQTAGVDSSGNISLNLRGTETIDEINALLNKSGIDLKATNVGTLATGAAANLAGGAGVGADGLTLQIGDTAESFNQLTVKVGNMSSASLGIGSVDISTQEGAKSSIQLIKNAINSVSSTRGDLGAIQNRLEHTINNLSVTTENMTAAESRIRDVDMAKEMMSYTKNNILVQASQAMLAQANQIPQGVLQLLQ